MSDRDGEWFWCLRHQRAERRGACRAADRLGPYPSPEAAADWQEVHGRREERWEEEDRRWNGEDDDDEQR